MPKPTMNNNPSDWFCECGQRGKPDGDWRFDGANWQHHHGYPVGHVVARFSPAIPVKQTLLEEACKAMLEALELDVKFHSRYLAVHSMDDFKASGYAGPEDASMMREYLLALKVAAITKANDAISTIDQPL